MAPLFSRITAGILLFASSPLLLLLGGLIRIKYHGPFFFRQIREGKDGVPFQILKLRTMVFNAAPVLEQLLRNNPAARKEWQESGCLTNDPRITGRLGRWARQLSIDEVPQLWNVCRGDMALIGPRPLELHLARSLPPEVRRLRNSVLPGMTGLWQVGPRSGVNIAQMQRYDVLYVRKRNTLLHLYILCRTPAAILRRTGQ